MQNMSSSGIETRHVMSWLPDEVHVYLNHTEKGVSIRSLAREKGVHASTVMRQVRKTEARRDDPLVDALLSRISHDINDTKCDVQSISFDKEENIKDVVSPHFVRLLRALAQEGSLLVVSQGVDTAVVVSTAQGDRPQTLEKAPTEIAELMALRGWIDGKTSGRISRYHITSDGRVALNRMMAEQEGKATGFSEAPMSFRGADLGESDHISDAHHTGTTAKTSKRSIGTETPIRVLARAKGSQPAYLSNELVGAAQRLHRDFVLGQFELSGGSSWGNVVSMPKTGRPSPNVNDRKLDARKRFTAAIESLGPELGQIVLAVCCHEQGMERIEADLSMPARSGKYMLRVGLNYLVRHYSKCHDEDHDLIY